MAKSIEKTRKSQPQRKMTKCEASKEKDQEGLRRKIKHSVSKAATAMVESTIEHAQDGQYQAMKYLFEMIGLFPATAAPEEEQQEDSLAAILLDRMGIPAGRGAAHKNRSAGKEVRRRKTP